MSIDEFHESMVEAQCRRCERRKAVFSLDISDTCRTVALNEIEISYRNEVELLRAYFDVFEEARG